MVGTVGRCLVGN